MPQAATPALTGWWRTAVPFAVGLGLAAAAIGVVDRLVARRQQQVVETVRQQRRLAEEMAFQDLALDRHAGPLSQRAAPPAAVPLYFGIRGINQDICVFVDRGSSRCGARWPKDSPVNGTSASVARLISDLCDEYGLQPSQIYRWQAAIFEHGVDVFDLKKGRHAKAAESAKDARIAKLEAVVAQKDAKIAQKNGVISELMEENVAAKNVSGEP